MTDELNDSYDVVVIGGGAAGLNGALMLARSRRSVAVIDSGSPRNAPADGVHGLLGHDGVPPAELLRRGREEVRGYGGAVIEGMVTSVVLDDGALVVSLTDGRVVRARRLLITSGLVDELPAVPGLAKRWGREVLHCPYCHGWEVRDRAIGILASSPRATHQALLFRQLSDDVVFFTNERELTVEQTEELLARDIMIIDGAVASLDLGDRRSVGVRLADGTMIDRDVLGVQARMIARATYLAGLGITPIEHPSGVGTYVPVDPSGRTAVPGVWAAGNVTDLMAQVGAAAAAGATAGAVINMDLIVEDTQAAVAASRARQLAEATS